MIVSSKNWKQKRTEQLQQAAKGLLLTVVIVASALPLSELKSRARTAKRGGGGGGNTMNSREKKDGANRAIDESRLKRALIQ